jgi:hypothetical protein
VCLQSGFLEYEQLLTVKTQELTNGSDQLVEIAVLPAPLIGFATQCLADSFVLDRVGHVSQVSSLSL